MLRHGRIETDGERKRERESVHSECGALESASTSRRSMRERVSDRYITYGIRLIRSGMPDRSNGTLSSDGTYQRGMTRALNRYS